MDGYRELVTRGRVEGSYMSDIWNKRDVANALTACAVAGQETAAMSNNVEYLRGHTAALRVLALTFGIAPGAILPTGQDAARVAYLEGAAGGQNWQ